MKTLKLMTAFLSCSLLLSGCIMAPDATGFTDGDIEFIQLEQVQPGQEIAVIETSLGTIQMILFPQQAPDTVAHFKKLVNEGFYDGRSLFVEPSEKRILTGAVDSEGREGIVETEDGDPLECEVSMNLWHFSGAVSTTAFQKSMFSTKMYSDSRFFIVGNVKATTEMVSQMETYEYPQKVVDAYKAQGGLPQYTGISTVFGQVFEGLEIVDQIAAMEIDENKNPTEDVKILHVTLSVYPDSQGKIAA